MGESEDSDDISSGVDELFNLTRDELERSEGDGGGGGGADEVCTASSVESDDASVSVNARHERADAAKWAESVHMHVRTDDLVRIRHCRCNHLRYCAREHQIRGRDVVEGNLSSTSDVKLDGLIEWKLNDDVRDPYELRTETAVQPA